MRARPPRPPRVASLLREALGRIFVEELQGPGTGVLTVTRVEMSLDLRTARVDVAVFGADPGEALRDLERRAGEIRRALASRVNLRYNPTLVFRLDPAPETEERMDRILKRGGS